MGRTLLVLALSAGCAGADAMAVQDPATAAPPAAQAASSLGLFPGEAMTFEVHLAGVLVGEAQLAVGELGQLADQRQAIVVTSRAATAGAAALMKNISDEATTTIDVSTGRPIALTGKLVNGEKRSLTDTKFEGRFAKIKFQRNDEPVQNLTVDFKEKPVHDAHSAMAQLRGWRATPGSVREVWVAGGRRMWKVDVTFVGTATIGTAVGNRRAVVFDGKSYRATRSLVVEQKTPARTFRVWLSDDADRVPLKVQAHTELGDVVMNLTEYARP